MANVTVYGPMLFGDDRNKRPSLEMTLNKPDTVKRARPADLWANPTDRSVWSRTLRRDLAETYPWYGSHDGAYWSLIEKGVGSSGPNPDVAAAKMRLRAKIKGKNANLAETLAEYRQAGSMFTGLARSIIHTYRMLRSGKPWWAFRDALNRDSKRYDKGLANRVLEANYGWIPMIGSVFDATEVVLKSLQEGFFQYESATSTVSYFSESANTSPPHATGIVYLTRETESWVCTAKVSARWKIRYPELKLMSDLGFTNPLSLAWDLTPYSFVADQLFPIGRTLASLDALVGVTDLLTKTSGEARYNGLLSVTGGRKPGESSLQTIRRYRSAATSGELPISWGGYKPSTYVSNIVNDIALLTQLQRNIK